MHRCLRAPRNPCTTRPVRTALAPCGTQTVTREHFKRLGLIIFQLPFAYCSVSQSGYCRYAEHLSISVGLQGAGLLRQHPELCACDSAPQWGWDACRVAPDKHGVCISNIQTAAMREADPGFCKLARQCVEGAAAAQEY